VKLLLGLAAILTVASADTAKADTAKKETPGPLAKYAPKTLSPSRDEKEILRFCMAYRDRELQKIPAIASGQTAYTSDGAETKYYDACLQAHRAREN